MDAEVRRREQRIHVRADRVERDVAQVEQAREADDDIEPQRKHDVDHREVEDAHPRLSGERGDEGQQRQRERDQRNPCPDLEGRRLAAPVCSHSCTPTLAASFANSTAALPPEGAQLAPWDGPTALIRVPPRLRPHLPIRPLRCPRRGPSAAAPCWPAPAWTTRGGVASRNAAACKATRALARSCALAHALAQQA